MTQTARLGFCYIGSAQNNAELQRESNLQPRENAMLQGDDVHVAALRIRNFRGIRELAWCPRQSVNCLIGPGDSCNTTLLDATET
ncbi:hypothetical protein CJU94_00715 [Paraburkholderia aromaticivorans]|uniref:Uncharacterized protein n=1 Tax=Paraburkholderia aromaticivorans TaxID=2026199 RepID=A0A248VD46_9BURK|nr:hypothetical protein CJU94_00715 [Paraburkholderia aromaticivorans]